MGFTSASQWAIQIEHTIIFEELSTVFHKGLQQDLSGQREEVEEGFSLVSANWLVDLR